MTGNRTAELSQGEHAVAGEGQAANREEHPPALSVVVITPDRYETIRRTLKHLGEQSVSDQLELLIVAPAGSALRDEVAHLSGFEEVRVVEVDEIRTTALANAAGVLAATAPVVAFVEDHAFPEPGWAQALIVAHHESWAAVGPVVGNANPGSLWSWADLIVGYSPWLEFAPAGAVEHLPAHNSSYKRAVLLEYERRLEEALAVESVLHWDLRSKGYELYLEPAARIKHLNTSRPLPLMQQQFLWGRVFAAGRARSWSPVRRLLYAILAPLVPAVRARRIARRLREAGPEYDAPVGAWPLVLLTLCISALGEMTGYAFGEANAQEKMCDLELHRDRHVRRGDRWDRDS
ncbi:MAG: glycosyltransferase [Anaerolineae bacterium]